MTTSPQPVNAKDLLSRTARMRALARRLVRDAAAADDLVQSALTRALESGVTPSGDAIAWDAAVLRNLARDRNRGEGRRSRREAAAARPEGLPDTADAVANAERQRDVAQAVLDLDEPYRSVVLLRFFEELPPRAIAKRLDRPVETVRKQTERGLALLRKKLESRYGDRGAWAVALLPLAGPDAVKVGGVGAMAAGATAFVRAAVALAILVAVGVFVVPALVEPPPPSNDDEVARVDPVESVGRAAAGDVAAPGDIEVPTRRASVAAGVAEADDKHDGKAKLERFIDDPAYAAEPFVARVVDLEGRPIAGLALRSTDESALSGGPHVVLGLFEVEQVEREPVTVRSDASGRIVSSALRPDPAVIQLLECVREDRIMFDGGLDSNDELVLVVAPAVRVAGRVVDHEGQPVAGSRVIVQADLAALPDFELDVKRPWRERADLQSSEDGLFDLGKVPTHPLFSISAVGPGSSSMNRHAVPTADDLTLELRLRKARTYKKAEVFGTVFDADGSAAEGVTVCLGHERARTDELGRYRIVGGYWLPGSDFSARSEDGRFVVARPPTFEAVKAAGGAGPIDLHLPARMNRLMGQVVDHDLKPVKGLTVLLVDGSTMGSTSTILETGRDGGSNGGVETDRRGTFVFKRMRERKYWIRVFDSNTMFVHDVRDVVPGPDFLRIVLPEDRYVEEISGRVVDQFRQPVVGAQVRVSVLTFSYSGGSSSFLGDPATTDEEGRFTLRDSPWRGLSLSVDARPFDSFGGERFPFEDAPPTEPLELVVDLDCDVVLELAGDPEVDEVRLLDGDDEPLNVVVRSSAARMHRDTVKRAEDGSFPIFEVSQRASTVVLFADDEEVRRVPIRLEAAKRNRLRL